MITNIMNRLDLLNLLLASGALLAFPLGFAALLTRVANRRVSDGLPVADRRHTCDAKLRKRLNDASRPVPGRRSASSVNH